MVGFLNLYKPEGITSAFAVGKVKKIFDCPCGHMGTLDPMASGVLPIGIGKTTRLFPYLLEKEKTYVARFCFGYETDTLDATGNIIKENGKIPNKEEIVDALPYFVGEILQVPPKYSAKNINGKRGYELARSGVDFDLPPKKIKVISFVLNDKIDNVTFEFTIKCQGGTYIRSLCRDLAKQLGAVATMVKLERTQCGIFNLGNSVKIDILSNCSQIKNMLISPDVAVDFEKFFLKSDVAKKIINGVYPNLGVKDGTYRVYDETEFLGIGCAQNGILKINSYVR